MIRFEFNKLIRRKIQERMPAEGIVVNGSVLNFKEYIVKLKEKLLEEANEVIIAEKTEDLKIELADVLEVIYTLSQACNIDLAEIEQARQKKREVNGDFTPSNYINYIEVQEDNLKVINYLHDKYRHYKL